jgi:endo-1,4-beta-xylanase
MRRFVALLALLLSLPAAAADPCTLRGLAGSAGIHVGAGFVEGSQRPEFRQILAREYDSLTAGVYWSSTEPVPGVWNFSGPDDAVAAATASNLRVRGHPLVWGRLALPAWVNAITDPNEMRERMGAHVTALVERYAGVVTQWDVVNEPLTFSGAPGATDGLEDYVFHRLLGPGYIAEALAVAHAADPTAKLFVNEILALRPGAKQDRLFRLAQDLLAAGAPLHGIGFQGHVTPPFAPTYAPSAAELRATLERFAALGLEVEITEIDVSLQSTTACDFARQARTYHDLVAACLAVPACRGITTWGIGDGFTWIDGFFGTAARPLPFDLLWQPKPAYRAIRDALREGICAGGSCPPPCDAEPLLRSGDLPSCACTAPAACAAATLPPRVTRPVGRACERVTRSESLDGPPAHRLLRRAARALGRAQRTATRFAQRGAIDAGCAAALDDSLGADLARTGSAERDR